MSAPLTIFVRDAQGAAASPTRASRKRFPAASCAGHYDEGGQGTAYGSYLKDNLFGTAALESEVSSGRGHFLAHRHTASAPAIAACGSRTRSRCEKTGEYRVIALVARPDAMRAYSEKPDRIMLEADDQPLAEFSFSPQFTTGKQYWGNYQPLPSQTVRLTEGTHVLCVRFDATPFNFGGLEFTPVGESAAGVRGAGSQGK